MQTMKYHIFFNFGKPPKRMMANTMREEARGKENTMSSAHAHTHAPHIELHGPCGILYRFVYIHGPLPYNHDGDQS